MRQKKKIVNKFLNQNEVIDILRKIDKVQDFDTKSRLYLVVLKYTSIDIKDFKIQEAEMLVKKNDIPLKIIKAIKDSLIRRKISIEANNLKNDTDYLFVNSENKRIHDCVLLREWRKFVQDNNLGKINMHLLKQSISFLQLMDYVKKIEQGEREPDCNILNQIMEEDCVK